MVAELCHQNLREQARAGPAAFDRQAGHWRLHDRLASPTAQLRADMADYLEAGGHVFQHLALVLADAAEHRAAAARAGAGCLMGDGLARQVWRQRLADRMLAFPPLDGLPGVSIAGSVARLDGTGVRFEFADQQTQAARSRGRASRRSGRSARGVTPPAASSASRYVASWHGSRPHWRRSRYPCGPALPANQPRGRAARWGRPAAAGSLTTWTRDTESRAGVQGLTHRILLRPAFFSANRHGSSWRVRRNCPPPIHCLDEQCELRRRQNHLTVHDRRPDKLAALEALGEQA